MQRYLTTDITQEPYLVIVETEEGNKVECVFIVGHTLCITKNATIQHALLDLFAPYYLSNLDYPMGFDQILPLFQITCLGVDYKAKFSPTFI